MQPLVPCSSDLIREQLRCVLQNLRLLEAAPSRPDLSRFTWVSPLTILPLAVLLTSRGITDHIPPENAECRRYLERFHFPAGVTKFGNHPTGAIPIVRFPAGARAVLKRGAVQERLFDIFVRFVGVHPGVQSSLSLALSEWFANIDEHAQTREGWIHAQYYHTKAYLDLCIVDSGIGILQSYRNAGHAVASAKEAVGRAIQGVSTKPELQRGTGIRTMIAQVTDALGGHAFLLSGDGAAYRERGGDVGIFALPVAWQGTIVVLRVPRQTGPVDYSESIAT